MKRRHRDWKFELIDRANPDWRGLSATIVAYDAEPVGQARGDGAIGVTGGWRTRPTPSMQPP